MLQDAGVINRRRQWSGGRTQLVQTGDILDRGPHSRKVMDLLINLEKQAAKAGGRVHALMGNHEAMNIAGRGPAHHRRSAFARHAYADQARHDRAREDRVEYGLRFLPHERMLVGGIPAHSSQ